MVKTKLDRYIGVNVEQAQYEELREEAFSSRMNVSSLIRKIFSERYKGGQIENK